MNEPILSSPVDTVIALTLSTIPIKGQLPTIDTQDFTILVPSHLDHPLPQHITWGSLGKQPLCSPSEIKHPWHRCSCSEYLYNNVPYLVADNNVRAGRLSRRRVILVLRWRGRCSCTPFCMLLSSDGRWVIDIRISSCITLTTKQ